jgi:hypothetical protein
MQFAAGLTIGTGCVRKKNSLKEGGRFASMRLIKID